MGREAYNLVTDKAVVFFFGERDLPAEFLHYVIQLVIYRLFQVLVRLVAAGEGRCGLTDVLICFFPFEFRVYGVLQFPVQVYVFRHALELAL